MSLLFFIDRLFYFASDDIDTAETGKEKHKRKEEKNKNLRVTKEIHQYMRSLNIVSASYDKSKA